MGVGLMAAEQKWKQLQGTDWLDASNINKFREELDLARDIHNTFSRNIENAEKFSLKSLEHLEQQCEKSWFEGTGSLHNKLIELKSRLKVFVEKIGSMFQKTVGYYNLFEVISLVMPPF